MTVFGFEEGFICLQNNDTMQSLGEHQQAFRPRWDVFYLLSPGDTNGLPPQDLNMFFFELVLGKTWNENNWVWCIYM